MNQHSIGLLCGNGSTRRETFSSSSDARLCHGLCLGLRDTRGHFLLSARLCKAETVALLNIAPSRMTALTGAEKFQENACPRVTVFASEFVRAMTALCDGVELGNK